MSWAQPPAKDSGTNTEQPRVDLTNRMAFRVAESAALIGVSAAFLRLEIARGNLNATRLGRRIVLMRTELERYLASRQTTTAARGGRSVDGADMDADRQTSVAQHRSIHKRGSVPARPANAMSAADGRAGDRRAKRGGCDPEPAEIQRGAVTPRD